MGNWNLTHKIQKGGCSSKFLVCVVVPTKGVHRSDMGLLRPVASICATLTKRWMDGRIDARCKVLWWAMLTDKSAKLKRAKTWILTPVQMSVGYNPIIIFGFCFYKDFIPGCAGGLHILEP